MSANATSRQYAQKGAMKFTRSGSPRGDGSQGRLMPGNPAAFIQPENTRLCIAPNWLAGQAQGRHHNAEHEANNAASISVVHSSDF